MQGRLKKESLIAAAVTFAAALLLLLFLFHAGMRADKQELALTSTPELQAPEEELVEPELITDLGESDASRHDAPAPAEKGTPEPAPVDNVRKTEPDPKPKPVPPHPKTSTQKKDSPVREPEPKANDEQKKKVTSKMEGKFSSRNGSSTGTSGKTGAGGNGTGILGNVTGRSFISCDTPKVALTSPVTVTVSVTINAAGRVVTAKTRKGSGASAEVIAECERAARTARWSEKEDTPAANGTITFRITPK